MGLSQRELNLEELCKSSPSLNTAYETQCVELGAKIQEYLAVVGNSYDTNPGQKSIMLLTVMELWVAMDKIAVKIFPLLREFNIFFPSDILDVLQLAHLHDMCRLQRIREYLQIRHIGCNGSTLTIFSDPVEGCFADLYYSESAHSSNLQNLYRRIESDAEEERTRKEKEWEKKSQDHENLVKIISESTCLCTEENFGTKIHNKYRCAKCNLQFKADQIRISGFEHPLPYVLYTLRIFCWTTMSHE